MACTRMCISLSKNLRQQMDSYPNINWSKVATEAFVRELELASDVFRHDGVVSVCCHRVAFRFWWHDGPKVTKSLTNFLNREARERAKEMINKGYIEGELNSVFRGRGIRGWWGINSDTL